MKMCSLKIDGKCLSTEQGNTILDAARAAGINIPTLCHIKNRAEAGACRICVVEDANGRLLAACSTAAEEGMELFTDTEKVVRSRRMTLSLMCENHRMDCDNCVRYNDCEFHALCTRSGIRSADYETFTIPPDKDEGACIVRDSSKCILCRRCEAACGLSLISMLGRGPLVRVGTALPLRQSGCAGCGQCAASCPTAALHGIDSTQEVWRMLLKKKSLIAAVVSPAASSMLGECFHDRVGCSKAGKTPAMLRKLGFDMVFSSDAFQPEYDNMLMREAEERGRVISGECPGIVSCIREHFPESSGLLSDSPGPVRLLADGIRAEFGDNVSIVYVGSCTAMKAYAGENGLDAVLTVPEAAAMLDRACVSRSSAVSVWRQCREEPYDIPKAAPSAEKGKSVSCKKLFGLAAFSEKMETGIHENGIIKAYACPEGCIGGGGAHRLTSGKLSSGDTLLREQAITLSRGV